MKSRDGWICRNAFGRGDVLCQVQCATYDKDTKISFKTVAAKSRAKGQGGKLSAFASCPSGYVPMSGGRQVQLATTKGAQTFDIRLDQRNTQYESSMPKGNGWFCETGFQAVIVKCFARCARSENLHCITVKSKVKHVADSLRPDVSYFSSSPSASCIA